ncbi:MAG: DNA polymerase Y family protein [Betaproteobacteria bacterium]|nr:DNA polymerase Y family protein [Betaproteobacteria bacterium]
MLWVALYLPELSLQIAARGARDGALVVSDGPQNRPTVFVANATAQEAGVRTKMTIAAARALVDDLQVIARDTGQEAEALHNFACWSCQFTPSVSVRPAEGTLLEVVTTLKMHGGISMLLASMHQGVQQMGYRASCGVAPTPLAAWLLAKARYNGYPTRQCLEIEQIASRLEKLPLALMDWSPDIVSKLTALGVMTFDDFLELPADGVAKRFGERCWYDVQRALGHVPDPQPYFTPPETFRTRTEFGFEVNDAMALLFPLRRLLSELEGYLRARGAGVLAFHIRLDCANRLHEEVTVGVGRPERNAERLLGLAKERLARTVLRAGVLAMGLHIDRLQPFMQVSESWLPDPQQQADSWFQLVDKLVARLGSDNVYRMQPVDDFRPESAWRTTAPAAPWKVSPASNGRGPRPLFLLPVPRKLQVDRGTPLCHGKIDFLAGPERMEFGWWDGKPALRDYFVGRNPHGETVWLYRELQDPDSWHLHGYFS